MNILLKKGKTVYIVCLIILLLPGLISLLHPGLHPTHDGEYHVIRFYEFYKTLVGGDIYPRWASGLNNGFGVPLFNFVYPFPNYFASLLHIFGINFIDGFKLNLFIGSIIGTVFFYLWTKRYWGDLGGLVAAVSYFYAPYRLLDIYIRGSVGEIWALAFLPGYLWFISKSGTKINFNYILFAGVMYALIIFSHNILSVMFSLFIVTYVILICVTHHKPIKFISYSLLSLAIGLGLSAVFWIPALLEKQFVRGLEIFNPTDHFVEFYELLIPSWGSGFSSGGIENRMSFQIGIVPLISIFASLFIIIFKKNIINRKYIYFCYLWILLTIVLMLGISKPIWEYLVFIKYFQFPWRTLSITLICTSFIAGFIVNVQHSKKTKLIFAGLIIILNIMFTLKYVKPAYYHDRSDNYYLVRKNFTEGTNSPGNIFNTKWFKDNQFNTVDFVSNNSNGTISYIIDKPTYKKISLNSHEPGIFKAKIAYFPGWKVWQNGVKKDVAVAENGYLEFKTSGGISIIEIRLLDTIIRIFAKLTTLITCVILVVLLFRNNIFKHENSN